MARPEEPQPRYIALQDAADALGIKRNTLYHYLHSMKLKPKKFPMDKRTYLSRAAFDRLLAAKQAGQEGKH